MNNKERLPDRKSTIVWVYTDDESDEIQNRESLLKEVCGAASCNQLHFKLNEENLRGIVYDIGRDFSSNVFFVHTINSFGNEKALDLIFKCMTEMADRTYFQVLFDDFNLGSHSLPQELICTVKYFKAIPCHCQGQPQRIDALRLIETIRLVSSYNLDLDPRTAMAVGWFLCFADLRNINFAHGIPALPEWTRNFPEKP